MFQDGSLIAKLLHKIGIKTEKEAEFFLRPDYDRGIHDPFLMRDMDRACDRLKRAIDGKERVVVYADYDCDGIPGAVILQDLFKKIGFENYEVYIPDRNSEGYGLNMEAIKNFSESGTQLLITIDLGITAVSEVSLAKENNIDVIITDHHLPPEVLPESYAILNPKIDDYPEKMLCGAGVVFKFVCGFLKKYGESYGIKNGWEKWLLDMAGFATLSDQVPLLGENRIIAYFGLKVLRKSRRVGLQKLFSLLRIEQKHINEDDVGFMIAPKLNAASRMDDPRIAFDLLSTDDEALAGALASRLVKINDDRKRIVANIMRETNKKFSANDSRLAREVIVIGNPDWRVGVLGLVAGKLVDEHKKPVFVWGQDENNFFKGSCRSDGSISVVELMTEAREYFLNFGGHELAGGFTVHSEKIHFLEEALSSSYKKVKKSEKKSASFDLELDLSVVNMKNWKELECLAPFGAGHQKPIFLFKNVCIKNIKKFGKNGQGEHLEITFSDASGVKIKAISFFSGLDSFSVALEPEKKINLLASFDLSRWGNKEELRLRVEDMY